MRWPHDSDTRDAILDTPESLNNEGERALLFGPLRGFQQRARGCHC